MEQVFERPREEPVSESPETRIEDEGEVKARLTFLFGEHARPKDAEFLAEKISECDVFVPELRRWTPEDLREFQEIANGEKSPESANLEEYMYPEYQRKVFDALYGKGARVLMVDLPPEDSREIIIDGESLTDLERKESEAYDISVSAWRDGNPELALTSFREFLKVFGSIQRFREAYIVKELEREIPRLTEDPKLKTRLPLRVVAQFGSGHTGLFHAAKKLPQVEAHAEFPDSSIYIFPHFAEAMRRTMFEKEVSDDLAIKSIAEGYIMQRISALSESTYIAHRITRHIVDRIFAAESREDMPEIPETPDELNTLVVAIRDEETKKYGRASI